MKMIVRNSFLKGVARILDIGGVHFITSPIRQRYISASGRLSSSRALSRHPDLADAHSIRSDFVAIAEDMRVATLQSHD